MSWCLVGSEMCIRDRLLPGSGATISFGCKSIARQIDAGISKMLAMIRYKFIEIV
jgi:hypothetical protein